MVVVVPGSPSAPVGFLDIRRGKTVSSPVLANTANNLCSERETHGICDGRGGNPGAKSGPMLVPLMLATLTARSPACQSQKTLSSHVWCR